MDPPLTQDRTVQSVALPPATPDRYRLYIDEAGDHARSRLETDPVGRRYMCLLGVMVRMGEDYTRLQTSVEDVKRAHLPYDPDAPPILHREDILYRRGPFHVLRDDATRTAFDDSLIGLIDAAAITVFGVVIDKFSHRRRAYRHLTDAYHYCLAAMLERYCGLLGLLGAAGDVLVEARGKTEDRTLKEEFRSIWNNGTAYMANRQTQATLTSRELKVKPKLLNIAGLQVADILAHPVKRDVLREQGRIDSLGGAFTERIITVATAKYNRQRYSRGIRGYGRILLT